MKTNAEIIKEIKQSQAERRENAKTTPGDWVAVVGDDERSIAVRQGLPYPYVGVAKPGQSYLSAICHLDYPNRDDLDSIEVVRKNALLIAASPDYHKAAVEMISRHDAKARAANFIACGCDDCTPFRPIISKALGNANQEVENA